LYSVARVFVTRELIGNALERLRARHDVELWPRDEVIPRADLLAGVAEADGLLSMLTDRIDSELLAAAPKLQAIANNAVGTDNVDLEAATQRGIPVGNTPDVLTDSTADLAVALMLAAARRLTEGDRLVRDDGWRAWSPGFMLGRDLSSTTVGVIGAGRIGSAVARRVEAFGCEVITAGRDRAELEHLLGEAAFVSLHCPLTPETRGLIGEAELRAMRDSAYLVNTARGPIVDPAALERALREGWIAGAALDVTDPEPLPGDHPLLSAPNLTVVPHVGSATERTRAAMGDLAVDNLLAALAGERMPRCANPEVYEGASTSARPAR
jgi:lactate dehydrogenase-like 2-hydroxyacid dehydrogenase